jgi:hypothetical protein
MRGIPTPSTDCSSAEPSPIFPYRPRPKTTKRSPSLQRRRHTRELGSSIARLSSLRPIVPVIMAVAPFMCMITTSTLLESSACAQTASRLASTDRFAKFVEEAPAASPCRCAGFVPSSKLKARETSARSLLVGRWA